jgi:D-galactose 1-dehydrogenase
MTNNSKEIGIGLVGLGSIGKVHEDVLASEPTSMLFRLVAVCDKAAKDTGRPFYMDYRHFLAVEGLQAVSIATPLHYDLALAAIKAGKHVLIEKPPTLTLGQLEEIERAGKEAGVTIFTAFHACYRPEVEAARKALAGARIKSITVRYREDVLYYCDPAGWIFDPRIAGGGVFMSSGINPISIIMTIMPDSKLKVAKVDLVSERDFRVESKGTVEFDFDNGHGVLDMDWFHKGPEIRTIEFQTTESKYVLDIVKGRLVRDGEIISAASGNAPHVVDQHLEYRGVFKKFYELITKHESLIRKHELKFMMDVYRS